MTKTISALVEAGNASAGPPLGPELGPLPVDIGQVVNTINEQTQEFEGMEVPVDVEVDEDTGDFTVDVGLPPAAALIKQRAGIASGSGEPNKTMAGNISFQDAVDIAQMKRGDLNALTLDSAVKEILGSCRSMGITIDDKPSAQVIEEVNNGAYDDQLTEEGDA